MTERNPLDDMPTIEERRTINKPWFPPSIDERPEGFECLVWHRGRWRHVSWLEDYGCWSFGKGSPLIDGDLGRMFAPLPWNTPEHEFYEGERS